MADSPFYPLYAQTPWNNIKYCLKNSYCTPLRFSLFTTTRVGSTTTTTTATPTIHEGKATEGDSPLLKQASIESINSVQSWSATWPRIWLQLTSFARPRCENPHRLQCIWTLYTIYWFVSRNLRKVSNSIHFTIKNCNFRVHSQVNSNGSADHCPFPFWYWSSTHNLYRWF